MSKNSTVLFVDFRYGKKIIMPSQVKDQKCTRESKLQEASREILEQLKDKMPIYNDKRQGDLLA